MLFSICPSAHTSESVSSVPVKPCRQPQCNRIILSHHHQIGEMLKTFKTTNQELWIWPTTLGFLFSQILFIVKILGQNPISTFFKFRNPVFRQKLNMWIITSTWTWTCPRNYVRSNLFWISQGAFPTSLNAEQLESVKYLCFIAGNFTSSLTVCLQKLLRELQLGRVGKWIGF